MFAEKDQNNTEAQQINYQKKLLTERDKNPNGVLTMILDMHTIYIKYLNQANNADKKCNPIRIILLKLEQKLQISSSK